VKFTEGRFCRTHLENHSAQLRRQQQLLALRDQGIDHKMLAHIWLARRAGNQ
jgi:hypothetical protein